MKDTVCSKCYEIRKLLTKLIYYNNRNDYCKEDVCNVIDTIYNDIENINDMAQSMEDRLEVYKKGIEKLGFKRRK